MNFLRYGLPPLLYKKRKNFVSKDFAFPDVIKKLFLCYNDKKRLVESFLYLLNKNAFIEYLKENNTLKNKIQYTIGKINLIFKGFR